MSSASPIAAVMISVGGRFASIGSPDDGGYWPDSTPTGDPLSATKVAAPVSGTQ